MLKIFVNTWGNYNENGVDRGERIELPKDEDELDKKLKAIADAMGDHDPEWAIHDYEWVGEIDMGEVHEMSSIKTWNAYCQEADELDECDLQEIAAAIEAFGYNFVEAMERHQRGCFMFYPDSTLDDVAYDIVNECLFMSDTPEILKMYFDYKAYARDMQIEGYQETKYGVICES